ncbi:UDP-xylose transporter 3 [Camellia lanceoleosa]|uniref:UDP-xylose transporter 3 n=1 Tax=Camellia lanceoleosa TaxID=1840588 RepID=A0ACC0FQE8_9ERIC|nr:UDP-xylose transporter 3 [Camellia lanceoleosa]
MTLDLSDFTKMGTIHRSGAFKKSNDTIRLVITTLTGMIFGYFIGISFPSVSLNKINLHSSIVSSLDVALNNDHSRSISNHIPETRVFTDKAPPKIYVPTNPRGAESLPPAIVVSQSDFYLRRLWGEPSEDLTMKPKYLVTFTVGLDQRNNIDAAVKSEWDQFEWSKRAIHVSVRKQTKWWYAKRFLHPDIIAAYEYIFIWDEDLGVEHFNGDKYIQLVKKHGLDISQPGLEPNNGLTWQMTKGRGDREVHKNTEEKTGWCGDPHLPPCAAFVEIMAPVFSREAWRCVWHMIQNDLVHGWGLDFALRRCVEPAHEKIGVVDSQWVVHQVIPSLGNQGQSENGKSPWQGVRDRCRSEWAQFQDRLADADKAYLAQIEPQDNKRYMGEVSGLQLGVMGALFLSVASSVSIVICNKALMSFLGFPFATTLTSWHLMVTYCSLHVAQHFNFFESKAVDMNTVMLFGILNGVSIGFLNLSLGFNSIGFYQMTKLAIIPFTVLLETIFLKKQFSQKIKFSLFLLLVGVGIASITDLQLNFVGAILSLLAIITTCVGQIGFIILSCLIAVSVNFSTFLVIGKTSPVTYQVLGHLKTCLVLAFGYTLLHDPFTSRNIIGILIAILGMALYSYFCSHEKKKKQLVDLSPPSQIRDKETTALLVGMNGQEKESHEV